MDGTALTQIARIRTNVFEGRSVAQLVDDGMIAHVRLTNRDLEKAFTGSAGAGLDPEALAHSEAVFMNLYLGLRTLVR